MAKVAAKKVPKRHDQDQETTLQDRPLRRGRATAHARGDGGLPDAWLEKPRRRAGIARALGDIARAKGMSQVAKDAGLSRESLYRALSADGNPSFATVPPVARALGSSCMRRRFELRLPFASKPLPSRSARHGPRSHGPRQRPPPRHPPLPALGAGAQAQRLPARRLQTRRRPRASRWSTRCTARAAERDGLAKTLGAVQTLMG